MQIAEGYEKGAHAYHATLPTDALVRLRDVMLEARTYGFEKLRSEQLDLGAKVRKLLEARGFPSVAAEGWKAPGVVVSYTSDPEIHSGKKFLAAGLQTASGVPLMCGEGPDFRTFAWDYSVSTNGTTWIALLVMWPRHSRRWRRPEEVLMRAALIALILSSASVANAAEPATPPSDGSVGSDVSDAARAVGHATRDAAKEVGHATRDVAKGVGHATRDATKAVGHATRDVVKETGQTVQKGANETAMPSRMVRRKRSRL